jgi:hypothetical protein
MRRNLGGFAAAVVLLIALSLAMGVQAQKAGGILRMPHLDSPASMSMVNGNYNGWRLEDTWLGK